MGAVEDKRVGEVMMRDVLTSPPATTLDEAHGLMRSARLRHLVVVEDRIVLGLLSHRTLLEASLTLLRERLGTAGAAALGALTIERLVQKRPLTIAPGGSLEAAASRMLALRVGCLPVTSTSPRGPRLEGLVTEAGLLRAAYLPPPPRS